ncbi:hypothetical protein GCK72_021891 [Caenorhabditis remanei]|uniref:Uncharacterized protein n=1 Tax=Caenorhabditis remanei TaxID=31234 RepID=A0A6A5GLG0_CAERE|nr:hypothetical protein GCK72_021891 [Caenorhabditis remanei]KAF1755322.1 hypothetical protein GCK72_021891 [Caenorhabditis remanei]
MGIRKEAKFAFTNTSAFAIYADLLGHSLFAPASTEYHTYADCFKKRKTELVKECQSSGADATLCDTYVSNGHVIFCDNTQGFSICNAGASFRFPTTLRTTTTTTAAATTHTASFPMGIFFGAFLGGSFLGLVLMLLICFVCRRKKSSLNDGLSTAEAGKGKKKKAKKNKKTGTTTGSFESTGSFGSTNASTTKTGKAKKAKKGKKNKKNTTKSSGSTA